MTLTIEQLLLLDDDKRRVLQTARERFLSAPDAGEHFDVRPEILHSWRRSLQSGVDFRRTELPDVAPAPRIEKLARTTAPAMQRLNESLAGTGAWGMLLDRSCVQVGVAVGDAGQLGTTLERGARPGALFRETAVGTNGAGTSVERLSPFTVVGLEHFRDGESNLLSTGVPIRDHFNRIVAVLSLNCRMQRASSLFIPFAQGIAQILQTEIRESASALERELFASFTEASRRPSQAVIAVSPGTVMANAAARALVFSRENADAITETILDAVRTAGEATIDIETPEGDLVARVRRIEVGGNNVGAVATLTARAGRSPGAPTIRVADPLTVSLRRAQESRIPTVVIGEHGSGRLAALREATMSGGGLRILDTRALPAEKELWWSAVEDAAMHAGHLVIRRIDAMAATDQTRLVTILERASAWCTATAASEPDEGEPLAAFFVLSVQRSPLRERRSELPAIVRQVMRELGWASMSCAPQVLAAFARHPWPGNIPQLRRVLAAAGVAAGAKEITIEHVPAEALAQTGGRELTRMEGQERELVLSSLREANWNREVAAQKLGISRATMYRKVKQFAINVPSSRS